MEEYIVDVLFAGKKEQLKTFSASPLEALDSMINFEDVEAVYKITRQTDKKNWSFNNDKLLELRKLRDLVNNEGSILQELRRSH